MAGYVKLFGSILGSTIWREDSDTKVVWVTMLALADRDGIVEASIPGLANYAGVSVKATEEALQKFIAPDPWSRTPDNDGRRIEKVDGGWRLLNHEKYRDRMSQEDIRERARIRQQRKRARDAAVTQKRDAGVTERYARDEVPMSRHTEAKGIKQKAEGKGRKPISLPSEANTETTDLDSRASRVSESLDFAPDVYLHWLFARAINWLQRFEGLSPEVAELELVKRIQAFPEYRERGELDRFWLCDRRFLTDEGREAVEKYSASKRIQ